MDIAEDSTAKWRPQDHVSPHIKDLIIKAQDSPIGFFHLLETLKTQKRTGWLNHGVVNPESISDHMHRMSLMSLLIRTPGVDTLKCMRISAVHDLAESIVGDITPFDAKIDAKEKHYREVAGINYIADEILRPYNPQAASEMRERWLDYEEQRCLEAVYVKDLDKFEMLVQCFEYERVHPDKDLSQFYNAVHSITTDEVKGWCDALMEERSQFLTGRTTPSPA